jgi:hypothetical protein
MVALTIDGRGEGKIERACSRLFSVLRGLDRNNQQYMINQTAVYMSKRNG